MTLPRVDGNPPLEAVLFDAGLTLITTSAPAGDVASAALLGAGIPTTREAMRHMMATAQAHIERRWANENWWANEGRVKSLFTEAYEHGLMLLPEVGADAALATRLADDIYAAYQDSRNWMAFPDVLPTLQALRAAGIRMGVVSDWGHGLEAILLELELGEFFSGLVVSSRMAIPKPHPELFRLALQRIQAPASTTVYIGDTYVKDVLGARAAGIAPVLLDRTGRTPVVDCVRVEGLGELLELIGVAPVDSLRAS